MLFKPSALVLISMWVFSRVRFKLTNTILALILVLIAGTKLMLVFNSTVRKVLNRINEANNNTRFKVWFLPGY